MLYNASRNWRYYLHCYDRLASIRYGGKRHCRRLFDKFCVYRYYAALVVRGWDTLHVQSTTWRNGLLFILCTTINVRGELELQERFSILQISVRQWLYSICTWFRGRSFYVERGAYLPLPGWSFFDFRCLQSFGSSRYQRCYLAGAWESSVLILSHLECTVGCPAMYRPTTEYASSLWFNSFARAAKHCSCNSVSSAML